jgi:TolB-like protein/DNA-binding winged helix-turn-helix (wHTH) protein
MQAPTPTHRVWDFGDFTLDLERGALTSGAADVHLSPRPFAVLSFLVERPGRLVTKDELLDAVWGHRSVTEGAITHSLMEIRRALGDKEQLIIRTVARRGYVFEAQVTQRPAPVRAQKTGAEFSPAGPAPPAASAVSPALRAVDPAPSPRRWPIALALALAVIAGGAWAWERGAPPPASGPAFVRGGATAWGQPSVAVLPFVDLGPEQDQSWFSEGLAEDLLNRLAEVPGLNVTARTSSFLFKGNNPDIATIARKLNVNHVLEGSIRRKDGRIRVVAQLIEAAGSTHVWSESYDREMDDLFAVQDEIARSVAQALELKLTGGSVLRPHGPPVEAYSHYLHARFLFNRRSPGDLEDARHYFRQSITLDPSFGQAWSGLAGAIQVSLYEGRMTVEEGLPELANAVERALALAPQLTETQFRAAAFSRLTGDHERAREHSRKALAAGPLDTLKLILLADGAAASGDFDAAIDFQRRAIALDPFAAIYHVNLAYFLSLDGRYHEAEAALRRSLELSPGQATLMMPRIVETLIFQGRYDEALVLVEALPEGEDQDLGRVLAYRGLGQREAARRSLERLSARQGHKAAFRIAEAYAQDGEINESYRWLATARARLELSVHPALLRSAMQSEMSSLRLAPLKATPGWETLVPD